MSAAPSTDPTSAIAASTADRYAVVGHPVTHSQSPVIHAAFAAQTGEAIAYSRLPSPLDAFAQTVRRFAEAGGRGCNITMPFKFEALALGETLSDRARLAGAANFLRFDAAGWFADNTDGIGLRTDIETHAGVDLAGRRLLIVGAGGAAAGVLGPLLERAPAQVVVANRTPAKAEALVERHAALAQAHGVDLRAAPLDATHASFDVVINASASSLAGAAVPVPASVLQPGALAVDLMYGGAAEPFLQWARAHGASARDGLGMLVEQAAEAFWLWRGVRPATADVLQALRKRLTESVS